MESTQPPERAITYSLCRNLAGSIPGDDPHQIPLLCSENEDGSRNNKKKPRVIKSKNDSHSQAPVKKKLLWKKGRKKSITRMPADRHREDEKVEFSDDDLDVPRDRIFRRNPAVIKFKSRSKSDWDIHDLPGDSPMHSSEEDFAMNVLHKRLQPNDDIGISQYFDALETINEAEEEALDEEFLSDKGSYAESELSEVSHAEHGIKSPPEEPPLVEQPKGPDPIIGRYRLTSSEGFDEVLKDLNVGMMKRKMANSVTPVNVIEILEDGTYVIRTETTLRTSEIRFKLNETFVEATLDGRNTQTFPTRQGNVIHLDQIGDSKKKEKDSVMTRDFQGDVMYMELIVGKTISKRVYERIVNE